MTKNNQTYPLPKKPIQWNNLIRIISLDTRIEGMYFIQTHKEPDLVNRKYKIWAYQQDVMEDRTNIFRKSKAREIKKKHEKTFSVRAGFYIEAGVGLWSDGLPYAIILPDHPDRLPPFIKQNLFLYNAFSQAIKERATESAIITHLEEGISIMGEQLARAEPDKQEDRFFAKIEKIGSKIFQRDKVPEPKKPEKEG